MKKNYKISIWLFFLSCFSMQPVFAAGEEEYILEKTITSISPVFMKGHIGDPSWIEGFVFQGNTFIKDGGQIGTFTGQASLLNPPMNPNEVYDEAFITVENDLPGIGSYRTTGSGVGLGSSTDDIAVAWSSSISNVTGLLTNSYGLSVGNGVLNPIAGQGNMTEIVNIRTGF